MGGGTVREEDGSSSVDVVGGDAEGGEGVEGDKHGEGDEVDDGGCSVSRWRPQKVDKRMVLEYTHGLFIT